MYCSNCGSHVPDGSKFCPYCGVRIAGTEVNNAQDDKAVLGQIPQKGEEGSEVSRQTQNESTDENGIGLRVVVAISLIVFGIIIAVLIFLISNGENDSANRSSASVPSSEKARTVNNISDNDKDNSISEAATEASSVDTTLESSGKSSSDKKKAKLADTDSSTDATLEEGQQDPAAFMSNGAYHKGDQFEIPITEVIGTGAGELIYDVADAGFYTDEDYNEYAYVDTIITNNSNQQIETVAIPDFYGDGYALTGETETGYGDEMDDYVSLKPGKKVEAFFLHDIENPFGYQTVEADFNDVQVMILDDTVTFSDQNGNVYYKNGNLIGDPYGISGWFISNDDGLEIAMKVQMTSLNNYHVAISTNDPLSFEGDAEYSIEAPDGNNYPVLWLDNITQNAYDVNTVKLVYHGEGDYFFLLMHDENVYYDTSGYLMRTDENNYNAYVSELTEDSD